MTYTCAYCGRSISCMETGDRLACPDCHYISYSLACGADLFVVDDYKKNLHANLHTWPWDDPEKGRSVQYLMRHALFVTEENFEAFLRGVRRLEGSA